MNERWVTSFRWTGSFRISISKLRATLKPCFLSFEFQTLHHWLNLWCNSPSFPISLAVDSQQNYVNKFKSSEVFTLISEITWMEWDINGIFSRSKRFFFTEICQCESWLVGKMRRLAVVSNFPTARGIRTVSFSSLISLPKMETQRKSRCFQPKRLFKWKEIKSFSSNYGHRCFGWCCRCHDEFRYNQLMVSYCVTFLLDYYSLFIVPSTCNVDQRVQSNYRRKKLFCGFCGFQFFM